MAQRRERGVFGTVVLGLFIVFNLFCLWLFSSTVHIASNRVDTVGNAFDQDAAFFLGVGAGFVEVAAWLVGGVILGILVLLTRGKAPGQR